MLSRSMVAGKFGLIPNREAVTVSLQRADGVTTVSIDNAWRKPVKYDRIVNLGLAIGTQVEEWHIPDSELNADGAGREIKPSNDSIEDSSGSVYVVLASQLKTLRTVWVCLAQKQRQGAGT
ncbi:MAG: hypothetical protein U0872_14175 [Planctomycetaceae bacterium]